MATLLRLADTDLRDAAVLEAGRDPGNAPALAGQAVTRLADAIVATEVGWDGRPAGGKLDLIPGQNPLKRSLAAVGKRLPQIAPSMPLLNGEGPPPPDRAALRDDIRAARALMKEAAAIFEVDLSGTGPAGSIVPVRPPPPPNPRTPQRAAPPVQKQSPAPAPKQPAPTAAEPHEVEGRSPIMPHAHAGSVASTAFWSLMDRWQVPDTEALTLIGYEGGLTKKGTRPRFKLADDAVETLQGLHEVDAALVPLKLDPKTWLHQPVKEAPFEGVTPLAFLVRMRLPGIRAAIRFLLQHGLKMSIST